MGVQIEVIPSNPAKQATWFFRLTMPGAPAEDDFIEVDNKLYRVVRVIWTPTDEEHDLWVRVQEAK